MRPEAEPDKDRIFKDFEDFTDSRRVSIVAEAGTAHGGDLSAARELIAAAAEAGADAVKFQVILAEEIVHPEVGKISLPGGPTDIFGRFLALEQPPEFYAALKVSAEAAGLRFLCSPFGKESARMLISLGADMLKIASPELNHYPLLEEACRRPLILSTGVSTLADIEESLSYLRSAAPVHPPLALLHCITAYPAPEEQYNLRLIPLLAGIFGVPVGLSDHSADPILVPALAASMGAVIIEKHLTLSRSGGGLDDPIALDTGGFASMVKTVRACEGRTVEKAGEMLSAFADAYDPERIEEVLGSGRKLLAPAEAPYYGGSNRSLVALRDIEKGEELSGENSALLRSEQGREPGLHPRFVNTVMGRPLRRPAKTAEGITWRHLLK